MEAAVRREDAEAARGGPAELDCAPRRPPRRCWRSVTRPSPAGASSTSRSASWPAASSSEGCTKTGSPEWRGAGSRPRSGRVVAERNRAVGGDAVEVFPAAIVAQRRSRPRDEAHVQRDRAQELGQMRVDEPLKLAAVLPVHAGLSSGWRGVVNEAAAAPLDRTCAGLRAIGGRDRSVVERCVPAQVSSADREPNAGAAAPSQAVRGGATRSPAPTASASSAVRPETRASRGQTSH